jgi:hypothetical protein
MADKPKPTINMPAGNSEVTPEPTGSVAPTRFITGNEATSEDYRAALSVSVAYC